MVDFSKDVLGVIFGGVDIATLRNARAVSRKWRRIINEYLRRYSHTKEFLEFNQQLSGQLLVEKDRLCKIHSFLQSIMTHDETLYLESDFNKCRLNSLLINEVNKMHSVVTESKKMKKWHNELMYGIRQIKSYMFDVPDITIYSKLKRNEPIHISLKGLSNLKFILPNLFWVKEPNNDQTREKIHELVNVLNKRGFYTVEPRDYQSGSMIFKKIHGMNKSNYKCFCGSFYHSKKYCPTATCLECGKKGHTFCENAYCVICKTNGHTKANCRKIGQNKNRRKTNSHNYRDQYYCVICKKKGHNKHNCWRKNIFFRNSTT